MEKMPPLESLLQDKEEKKEQSDDEMMSMCKILNAAFGGETVEV